MLHQHLTKIPPAPSTLRPGIDPALDEVTLRGLAKAPGQRFAGTGELAEAVFAAARAPGCEPVAPVAGSSGVTPRETGTCPLADRASVSYTRSNRPGEPTAEANARLAGAGADRPTSWSATTGEREGPYARTEDADGTCHVLLGWDAAAYAAEVVDPDCDAADRAAGALAPPARADLPST